jgi:phenylacetate-CoA ligase
MSMTRSAIESVQIDQLNKLIAALVPGNRFYSARLEQAGLTGGVSSLAEYARRMPVTTKSELMADQQQHPPYGSNLTFPLDRYTRFHQTSATTGNPIRWLDTPEDWDWLTKTWIEVYRAAGVTSADRVYFAFSFGPFIGFWMAFDAAQRLGCLCVPGGGLGSAARLRAILENEVTVLCCTPTYALRLGEVAAQEGIDLGESRVRTIIVAGEPGGSIPSTRQAIVQAWPGARPFDHHGMTEVGPVTHEWAGNPGTLAVMESAFIAEVVDPVTGGEVEPGQTGELILTNLGRIGSPVLRYRTGDLVKKTYRIGDDGRAHLALDGGILSRVDDMIIVRGTNLYPAAVETVIRQFPDVAEYRAEIRNQQAMTELSIVIEPVPGCVDADKLAEGVCKALQAAFLMRIPVTAASVGTLPRFELKACRWVRV